MQKAEAKLKERKQQEAKFTASILSQLPKIQPTLKTETSNVTKEEQLIIAEKDLLEYRIAHFLNVKACDPVHFSTVKFCGKCEDCKDKVYLRCAYFQRFNEFYRKHEKCMICAENGLYQPFHCSENIKHCNKVEVDETDAISSSIRKLLEELKKRIKLPKSGTTFKWVPSQNLYYCYDVNDYDGS
jgi:hypothetical protein